MATVNIEKLDDNAAYTQDDICIIHLSDLHIMSDNRTQAKIPKVLVNLVSDIKAHTAHMKECIIVVSGDVINEARYESLNVKTAKMFFESLRVALNRAVIKEILFCPGNHDVKRGIDRYSECAAYMNKGATEIADFRPKGYEDYFSLTNSIRNSWGFSAKSRSFYSTFIRTNCLNAVFVVLDLAWNSMDINNKEKPLSIGTFQLSELYNEFKECCIQEPDVVIFVSHYPLIFIEMHEQQALLNKLLAEEYFNADLFLCGHIHDVDTINYSTHEHSILSLVTGIGWPEVESSVRIGRRYSIYEINPIRNSCSIVVRKGIDAKFDYDYSIYTKVEEQTTKKIVYPLRIPHKNLPYISMKTSTAFDKDYFISSEMSNTIKKVSKCVSEIQFDISSLLHSCKSDFIEQIYCDRLLIQKLFEHQNADFSNRNRSDFLVYFEDYLMNNLQGYDESYIRLITDVWETYCSQNHVVSFRSRLFQDYLWEICRIYERHIRTLFSDAVIVRPHFRKYNKNQDCYECMCFYPPTTSRPKDVKWGGLIKDAYINHEPFIYSANSNLNATPTDWQEFITIVPTFANYQIEFPRRGNRTKYHSRPLLSFGISVKHCDDSELKNVSRILAIFHYLQIQNDLSDMISYFVGYFGKPF